MAPGWQKESAIKGVKYRLENPQSLPSDAHDEWLKEKHRTGWIYGIEKDENKKTHPCIVSYDKLPPEQKAKDTLFITVVDGLRELLEEK